MAHDFKTTGSADIREQIANLPEDMLEPKQRLEKLLRSEVADKQFNELTGVTYHHDGAALAGHAMLDALETAGFSIDDFDAVGALTTAGIPLVTSMISAAASRGQELDGFVMDFVFPSVKGPSIKDKRVILVDAWLSEKSFVQTSSVVTLTHGNELNLDFAVLENEGAQVLAIASLIGSTGLVEDYAEKRPADMTDLDTHFGDELPHNGDNDKECDHRDDGEEHSGHHQCTHADEEGHVCKCGGHHHTQESTSSPSSQFIKLINPVTENSSQIPFIPVFSDKDLQA
ncbi:hypothetical protein ACFQY8_00235 [Alloscardovia venturai]|uniref:Orotate phosphoribosyltransferase n=1 Tax=Alloscardovia venturai TaxID=1769421 RepID=A0ABW2Y337_9BIFI